MFLTYLAGLSKTGHFGFRTLDLAKGVILKKGTTIFLK
jgi:hypothetical protein